MQSRNQDWVFGVHFNYGTDVPYNEQFKTMGGTFPPVPGNFELLDGTPFMLLDGTNFLLL